MEEIKLQNGEKLDKYGELIRPIPVDPDPFDPPGYQPDPVMARTGVYFLEVPIYGWPISVIWKNNPLQFAAAATGRKMAAIMSPILAPMTIEPYYEEVRVGPYSWQQKLMFRVSDGTRAVRLNAGLEASTYVRDVAGYASRLIDRVAQALAKENADGGAWD